MGEDLESMTDDELDAEFKLCTHRAEAWCKTPWHNPKEAQASARYWEGRAKEVNSIRVKRLDKKMRVASDTMSQEVL
jgi:hypothetical protein